MQKALKSNYQPINRSRLLSRAQPRQKEQVHFKRLLVAVDFSETSDKALDYATNLASEFGAQILLLHVLESPTVFNSSNPAFADWDKEATRTAKSRLDQLAQGRIDEFIPVNSEVHIGRAYQIICETAQSEKCDLIVIGTHGFTGLKHILLGSTAEKVIRHAPCSVLVVREPKARKTQSTLSPRKILFPTDFSKPAERALTSATALAKQYEAELHVLYVVPIHYAVGDYDLMDYRILEADQKAAGEKQLASMKKTLLTKNLKATAGIRYGRPATEITESAKELKADLIVMSTHGRTGWERVLLGSTTEEVVRHASCPTLVVRSNPTNQRSS